MTKPNKKSVTKVGLPPGTVVFAGEHRVDKVRIIIFDYDEKQFTEKEMSTVEECFPYKDKPSITWINIDGLQDAELIQRLGNCFGIHPLVLEDILHTQQRPKFEDFDSYLFIVLRMIYAAKKDDELASEQVSIIVGNNYVISFLEDPGDLFDPVRDRIRNDKGRIRKMGADYLAYSLIDMVVDNYFLVLENLTAEIEQLEDDLLSKPDVKTAQQIHLLKREIIFLRKTIWPLRELISGLQRSESKLIRKTTAVFLRDVYDHTIQVLDTVETFRDMLSGMLDIYLSSISNRMNEVMKVLTVISTIFMPLTFIVGVYGMNFKYMPELEWRDGYFVVLGVMAVIAVAMIIYFKRRKWL